MNIRLWGFFPAVVLMASGLVGSWTTPAMCAETTATVVVRMADGTESTRCVSMPEGPVDGLTLLRSSGLPIVTKDFGGSLGAAVCRINGFGNDPSDCPGSQGHWHYWHLVEGDWQESELGPAAHQVQVGAIEGWSWVSEGSIPPRTKPDGECVATKSSLSSSAASNPFSLNRYAVFVVLAATLLGALTRMRRRRSC